MTQYKMLFKMSHTLGLIFLTHFPELFDMSHAPGLILMTSVPEVFDMSHVQILLLITSTETGKNCVQLFLHLVHVFSLDNKRRYETDGVVFC